MKVDDASTLPAAVQATFKSWVRNSTDARGSLTVEYVQTTVDGPAEYASNNFGVGQTPVYYLFVQGTYHAAEGTGCARQGCTIPPGDLTAIIGPDGGHCDCWISDYAPDLSKYGTPVTTILDVGS